jgi:hypothetical protein
MLAKLTIIQALNVSGRWQYPALAGSVQNLALALWHWHWHWQCFYYEYTKI